MANETPSGVQRAVAVLRRHPVLISAVVLAVAIYLGLPLLLRPLIERRIGARLGQPIHLGALHWQPLRGVVIAHQIVMPNDGTPPLRIATLLLDVDLTALVRRRLVFDRIVAGGLSAAVLLDEHYRLTVISSDEESAAEDPALPELEVNELLVQAAELRVCYPVRGEVREAPLTVERLSAREIRFAAGGAEAGLKASLDGSIAGAALTGNIDLHLSGEERVVRAGLTLSGLRVDRKVIDLPGNLESLSGQVRASATFEMSPTVPGGVVGLDLRIDDAVVFDQPEGAFSAASISAPALRFDVAANRVEIPSLIIADPVLRVEVAREGVLLPWPSGEGGPSGSDSGSGIPSLRISELRADNATVKVRYPVARSSREASLVLTKASATAVEVARGGERIAGRAVIDGAFEGSPLNGEVDLRIDGDSRQITATAGVRDLNVDRSLVDLPAAVQSFRGKLTGRAVYESAAVASSSKPTGVQGAKSSGLQTTKEILTLDLRVDGPKMSGERGSELSATQVSLPKLQVDLGTGAIDLGEVKIEAPKLTVDVSDDGVDLPFAASGGASGAALAISSGMISLRDGRVTVQRRGEAVTFRVKTTQWGGLRPRQASPLRVQIELDPEGSMAADGTLSIEPLHLDLNIRAQRLALPRLTRLVSLPVAFPQGTAGGAVNVKYGDDGLRLNGKLRADSVKTAPPTAVRPAEVLAVHAAEAELRYSSAASPALEIESLKLGYPYVMVQRHDDGVFPYSLFSGSSDGGGPSAKGEVRLRRADIEGGRLELLDSTLDPTYWSSLTDVRLQVYEAILAGELTVDSFTVAGRFNELSPAELSGSLDKRGLSARARIDHLLLDSLNPFLPGLLGYRATAGRLSLTTKAVPVEGALNTETRLVLSGVEVEQTGPDVIQSQSGVPFRVALSLIKTPAGSIELRLPVAVDTASRQVSVGSVIGQAIRSALLGAITSPLRLLGNWFGFNNAPHAFAIDPISFATGAATLDEPARQRIDQIGRILEAHPSLLLVALPQLTEADVAAVGIAKASQLAQARNAALYERLVQSTDGPRLPADRLLLAEWKPARGAKATNQSSLYLELQAR